MKSTVGEDAMKTAEITTKDLECYISLADVAVGFMSIDSNFERTSTMGEMLSSSITCYREIIYERKSQSDVPNFNTILF